MNKELSFLLSTDILYGHFYIAYRNTLIVLSHY